MDLTTALILSSSFILALGIGILFVMNHFTHSNARHSSLPYHSVNLLTVAEAEFLRSLETAMDGRYHVFTQVRLANVVSLPTDPVGRMWEMFNAVGNKCVDFVIWDQRTLKTVLVVELDDSSHRLKKRQERDEFVDRSLRSAGIPIFHQNWSQRYNPQQLQREIFEKISSSGHQS